MTPPKYLKPLLVVSLLLNVFLIGGVGACITGWSITGQPRPWSTSTACAWR